jgi:hypothetical protein
MPPKKDAKGGKGGAKSADKSADAPDKGKILISLFLNYFPKILGITFFMCSWQREERWQLCKSPSYFV